MAATNAVRDAESLRLRTLARLARIVEYAEAAVEHTAGQTLASLRADELRNYAVLWALGAVGRLSRELPPEVRSRVPAAPWDDLNDLGVRLIEVYYDIDWDRVWIALTATLPALIPAVRRLRDELAAAEPPAPPENA